MLRDRIRGPMIDYRTGYPTNYGVALGDDYDVAQDWKQFQTPRASRIVTAESIGTRSARSAKRRRHRRAADVVGDVRDSHVQQPADANQRVPRREKVRPDDNRHVHPVSTTAIAIDLHLRANLAD
jgi:hypothetical protein